MIRHGKTLKRKGTVLTENKGFPETNHLTLAGNHWGFHPALPIRIFGKSTDMDTQPFYKFFTRPQKLLLGACSTLSGKLNLPPVAIRIALVILTLLVLPLGILVYIGVYLMFSHKNKFVTLALLGAVLGVPMSYYFQPDMVKNHRGGGGMFSYLTHFSTIVDEYDAWVGNGWSIIFNVLLSVAVFALVGGIIGYVLDKRRTVGV